MPGLTEVGRVVLHVDRSPLAVAARVIVPMLKFQGEPLACTSSVVALPMVTGGLLPRACQLSSQRTVPPLMVKVPVSQLCPLRTRVPLPALVIAPLVAAMFWLPSLIVPEKLELRLSAVLPMVSVMPAAMPSRPLLFNAPICWLAVAWKTVVFMKPPVGTC